MPNDINEEFMYTIQHTKPYIGESIPLFPPDFNNLYLVSLPNDEPEKTFNVLLPDKTQIITFNKIGLDSIKNIWTSQRPDLEFEIVAETDKYLKFKTNNELIIKVQTNGIIRANGTINNDVYNHLFRTTWSIIYAQNQQRHRFNIKNQFKPR